MVGENGGCGGGLLLFGGMEVKCVVVFEGEMIRRWAMWNGNWGVWRWSGLRERIGFVGGGIEDASVERGRTGIREWAFGRSLRDECMFGLMAGCLEGTVRDVEEGKQTSVRCMELRPIARPPTHEQPCCRVLLGFPSTEVILTLSRPLVLSAASPREGTAERAKRILLAVQDYQYRTIDLGLAKICYAFRRCIPDIDLYDYMTPI